MMRKYLHLTLAVLCLAVIPATVVQAQDLYGNTRSGTGGDFEIKPYAGIGIGAFGLEYKDPDAAISQKSTVFGGYAKFGADIGDYLGIEVRVGTTSSGTQSYPTGTAEIPVPFDMKMSSDYFISYLAKFQYPVTVDFKPYVMLGGTTAKIKGTVSVPLIGYSSSQSVTKTGFTYGFGANYYVAENLSIGGEWMQYWTTSSCLLLIRMQRPKYGVQRRPSPTTFNQPCRPENRKGRRLCLLPFLTGINPPIINRVYHRYSAWWRRQSSPAKTRYHWCTQNSGADASAFVMAAGQGHTQ